MARPEYQALIQPFLLMIPVYSPYGSCVTSRPYRSMTIKSRPFHRPVGSHVRVLRHNIPFVHRLKYLDITCDRTRKCRIRTEINKKQIHFRTFNSARCRFTSVGLSAKIKLAIHEALIRSLTRLPRPRIGGRNSSLEVAAPTKLRFPQNWQLFRAHTGSRFAYGFKAMCCRHP
jgi:hypothetical protein